MVLIRQQASRWGSDKNVVAMRASQLYNKNINSLIEDLQTFGNTFTTFSPISEQVVLVEDPNLGLAAVESASSKRGFGTIHQDSFNETIEYKFQSFSYIGTANLLSIATRAETPISDADYNIAAFEQYTPANEKKFNVLNNLISVQKSIFAYHNPMFASVNANIFTTKAHNRNLINVMYDNVGLLDNDRVVSKYAPIEVSETTDARTVRDIIQRGIKEVCNYNNSVMTSDIPEVLITLSQTAVSILDIMFTDTALAYGVVSNTGNRFFNYMQSIITDAKLSFRIERENVYNNVLLDLKERNSEHPLILNAVRKFEEDVLGSITITNVSSNSAILLSPLTHPIKIKRMLEEAGHLTDVYSLTTYMMPLPLMTTMDVLTLDQQESGTQIRSVIIPFSQAAKKNVSSNRSENKLNELKQQVSQNKLNEVKPNKEVK